MQLARVHVTGDPTPAEALELHKALFPIEGDYLIEPVLAKATAPAVPEEFEEWFLQQLVDVSRRHYVNARYSIWQALDRLLEQRGVRAPSNLDLWELNRALFDLTTASTARMVGLNVPVDLVHQLQTIGFSVPEVLDFPALAYRMGLLYRDLSASTPTSWPILMQHARSMPLTAAEDAAVQYVRHRGGIWMKPIFDRDGTLWTAEREMLPVRTRASIAIARRQSPREAARELEASNRAQGIERDAKRVMRTEIAEARNRGAWKADSKRWAADAKIFRLPSRMACKVCLRLYLTPEGTPRLYDRREIEANSAGGPNTGPQENWLPVIGATHPNCACPPWQAWIPQMQGILASSAAERAERLRELGVFAEAA